MPRAIRGVLIECEPAIKSIIMMIDKEHNDIVIEDIDDCRLVVKETKVEEIKQKLEERLKETYRPEQPLEDSE